VSATGLLGAAGVAGHRKPAGIDDADDADRQRHTVPNIRWSTQLAQIAAGKYVAGAEPFSTSPSSPRRLPNIYAELGTTMASVIVTFPTVWAHLIGQLLYYMGENNIVFGSDSLWYGGPQWQIEALWRSRIPDDIADRWGYPQLNEGAKRKILGLNSARLYGMAPAAGGLRERTRVAAGRTDGCGAARSRVSGTRRTGRVGAQRRPVREAQTLAGGDEDRSQQRTQRLDAGRRVSLTLRTRSE
jgi:hypothetical protein